MVDGRQRRLDNACEHEVERGAVREVGRGASDLTRVRLKGSTKIDCLRVIVELPRRQASIMSEKNTGLPAMKLESH